MKFIIYLQKYIQQLFQRTLGDFQDIQAIFKISRLFYRTRNLKNGKSGIISMLAALLPVYCVSFP